MDKTTRILILYSLLANGERINKTIFCFENDYSHRSFDRDIEDIRMFLSESFSPLELNYNRQNKTYYIKGAKCQQLEVMEYLFLEKVLYEISILRNDEFNILKKHLINNTRDISNTLTSVDRIYGLYKSPDHNKALLKIHGDLELAIRNQKYISLTYNDESGGVCVHSITPYIIRYKFKNLYLIGYIETESRLINVKVDRVYSFEILRDQTDIEKKRVDEFIKNFEHSEFIKKKSELVEIVLECNYDDYENLYNEFNNVEILNKESGDTLIVRLNASEKQFIFWYLTYPNIKIKIVDPQSIKKKILNQAQTILKIYGGRD